MTSRLRHLLIATAALGFVGMAHAGPGHAHGDHSHASAAAKPGHAAALGRPGDAAKVTRTIEIVSGDDMRYRPGRIEVKRGETVRIRVTNTGTMKHELVIGTWAELKEHAEVMRKFPDMEHDDPNAAQVGPGGTGEIVWHFTRAGTFDFACLMPGHFEAGMKGKIVVRK